MAAANAFFPRQTHSSGRVLDSADFLTENKMRKILKEEGYKGHIYLVVTNSAG